MATNDFAKTLAAILGTNHKSTYHYVAPFDTSSSVGNYDSPTLSELDIRALKGDRGAKAAQGALSRILGSSAVSEGLKKRAQKLYKTGNGELDKSLVHDVQHVLGNALGGAFNLIDKPKRAVVATEEEILHATGALKTKKKGESWVDHVLRDKSYGYGDVLHELAAQHPGAPGAKAIKEDRWNIATAGGLVGDVVSDPLSYLGTGVVAKAGEAAATTEQAAKALDAVDSAAKVASKLDDAATARRASKGILDKLHVSLGDRNVTRKLVHEDKLSVRARAARMAQDARKAGDIPKAQHFEELVAKSQHGIGKLSGKELDELGLRGGLRTPEHGLGPLSGRTVVPWDLTRQIGAPFRALDRYTLSSPWGREIANKFGEERLNLFRNVLRDPKATNESKATAILGISGVRFQDDAERYFLGHFGQEFQKVLKEGLDKGVKAEDLFHAVNGDEQVLARVKDTWGEEGWKKLQDFRNKSDNLVNEKLGQAVKGSKLEASTPLALNADALKAIHDNAALSPILETGTLRHLYPGMEIVKGQELGSAQLAAEAGVDIKDLIGQAEHVIRQLGGPENVYDIDGFRSLVAEFKANGRLYGRGAGVDRLRTLGIVHDQPFAKIDTAAEASRANAIERLTKHYDDTMEALAQGKSDIVGAAHAVQTEGSLDGAITQLKANIDVLKQHSIQTEDAYDAAKAAGASPNTLSRLRREMYAAGADVRTARQQVQFLETQAGRTQEDIVRRLGTVQSEVRTSLTGENPIVSPAYSTAEGMVDQPTEAGRIFNNPEAAHVEATQRADQAETALDLAPDRNLRRRTSLAGAVTNHQQAAEITALMQDQSLPEEVRQALGLHAAWHEGVARMDELGQQAMTDDGMLKFLKSQQGRKTIQAVVDHQMVQFGKDLEEAPRFVAEAMFKAHDTMIDPIKALKAYDAFIRGFKTYAILTPGFPVRNSFGAFFNNFVAGIDLSSYEIFGRQYKKYAGGWLDAIRGKTTSALEAVDEQWRPYFAELERRGEFADANRIVGEVQADINPETPLSKGHPLSNWRLTRGMRRLNERVEQYHRGALMLDTLRKSTEADLASGDAFNRGLERVYHFHFDYGDLSKFEKDTVRRVVPFWVWTSRNLPLQLEQIAKNPRMYERFNIIKDNLSKNQKSMLVPDYVRKSPVAIFFDRELPGHQHLDFLTPDLPFNNVPEQLQAIASGNPLNVIGPQASPAVRLPFELWANQQFFANIPLSDKLEDAPSNWTKIPGLMEGLKGIHLAKQDVHGNWKISNKNLYVINSILPTIAQTRRLLPSESKYHAKWFSALTSFFGLGTHNVTAADKTNAAYSISDRLQRVVADQRDQGKIATP